MDARHQRRRSLQLSQTNQSETEHCEGKAFDTELVDGKSSYCNNGFLSPDTSDTSSPADFAVNRFWNGFIYVVYSTSCWLGMVGLLMGCNGSGFPIGSHTDEAHLISRTRRSCRKKNTEDYPPKMKPIEFT